MDAGCSGRRAAACRRWRGQRQVVCAEVVGSTGAGAAEGRGQQMGNQTNKQASRQAATAARCAYLGGEGGGGTPLTISGFTHSGPLRRQQVYGMAGMVVGSGGRWREYGLLACALAPAGQHSSTRLPTSGAERGPQATTAATIHSRRGQLDDDATGQGGVVCQLGVADQQFLHGFLELQGRAGRQAGQKGRR